jgi:hypothetical protein
MQVTDRQLVHLLFNRLSQVRPSLSGTYSVKGQVTLTTAADAWVSFKEQGSLEGVVTGVSAASPGEKQAAETSYHIEYIDVGWSIELNVSDGSGRAMFGRSCLDAEANLLYVEQAREHPQVDQTEKLRKFLLAALLHGSWTQSKPPGVEVRNRIPLHFPRIILH